MAIGLWLLAFGLWQSQSQGVIADLIRDLLKPRESQK